MKHSIKIIITLTLLLFFTNVTMAQVPAGKYNTTNYPEDRKAIESLQFADDSIAHLNDDYIAVGPEGRVSYGAEQWAQGFKEHHASFKSVVVVPGTYVLRVYNGDAAVKNMTVDVVFNTPKGDMKITVVRTETFIKENGKWHFVAGQGTKKASEAELKEMEKSMQKNKAQIDPILFQLKSDHEIYYTQSLAKARPCIAYHYRSVRHSHHYLYGVINVSTAS